MSRAVVLVRVAGEGRWLGSVVLLKLSCVRKSTHDSYTWLDLALGVHSGCRVTS